MFKVAAQWQAKNLDDFYVVVQPFLQNSTTLTHFFNSLVIYTKLLILVLIPQSLGLKLLSQCTGSALTILICGAWFVD